ncbi:MAG TPA: RnfABCDGE type electron transport complex subunit G [Lachnospiraceae bacterium]|nr:RnfABCDGE type electron transport complex subunit G [Lachnospiraceae bacterium]
MSSKTGKNTIVKDAIALFSITIIAAILLAFVYEITKDPIAKQVEASNQKAYQSVYKEAKSFAETDEIAKLVKDSGKVLADATKNGLGEFDNIAIDKSLQALDDGGNVIGYIVNVTTGNGYGGNIAISIGITLDGTVKGVEILSMKETAGLGAKASEDSFKGQYKDKSVESFTVTKTGAKSDSEIDAISGATITSKAVTNAVNAGIYFARNCLFK